MCVCPKKKNIIYILIYFLNVSPVVEFLVLLMFVCSVASFSTLGIKQILVGNSFVHFLNQLVFQFSFIRQLLAAQAQFTR